MLVLEKAPSRGGGNSSINMGEYTWVDDVDGAVKYITGFTKGHTPEEIARAWAEECYNNMDYCDHWGVKTEKKKGTNASGGTSSCETAPQEARATKQARQARVLVWRRDEGRQRGLAHA